MARMAKTKSWKDWIDYWAVDFNYQHKKEIIRVIEDGEEKEEWTGNSEIELVSMSHTYDKPGRYQIAVRVVDILGQDTLQTTEVNIQ